MVAQRVEPHDDNRDELLRRLAGLPHREENVIADDLEIDHTHQRRRIRQAMDGQHRLLAIKRMGYGDQFVPCLVYDGLPWKTEAALFDTQGYTKALSPQERFRSAIERGDPDATTIEATVRASGFVVNTDDGELSGGRIRGVAAPMTIHRDCKPGDLTTIPTMIRDAFGTA